MKSHFMVSWFMFKDDIYVTSWTLKKTEYIGCRKSVGNEQHLRLVSALLNCTANKAWSVAKKVANYTANLGLVSIKYKNPC